jgi:ADP-heptose:LPS heptosyltransferase
VIVVPLKKGIRTETGKVEDQPALEDFYKQMRQEQFDIVLNMQGNGTSANPFIKQLGARITAGLTSKNAEKLDLNLDYYYYQSETIRYIEVAGLIGATTTDLEPEIQVLQEDEEAVIGFISGLRNKKYVVLHPVAMDMRRMWPIENYAKLADELRRKNVEVVFTGSAEDTQAIDHIIADMNGVATNACGNFTLGELSVVLSKASLMIGADTGPLHLARAVHTPTIGFYWAPNLINWGPVTRKIHRPLVSWKMECPLCGVVPNDPYPFEPHTDSCSHLVSFVRDITMEQVIAAAEILLGENGGTGNKSYEEYELKGVNN